MLDNHYLRLRPKGGGKLNTVIESAVYYNGFSDTQLTTKRDIFASVYTFFHQHPEEKPPGRIDAKYVGEVIDDLVSNGWVQEVIGVQLEKLLEKARQ